MQHAHLQIGMHYVRSNYNPSDYLDTEDSKRSLMCCRRDTTILLHVCTVCTIHRHKGDYDMLPHLDALTLLEFLQPMDVAYRYTEILYA